MIFRGLENIELEKRNNPKIVSSGFTSSNRLETDFSFLSVSDVLMGFFPHAEGYVKNTVVSGQNTYDYVYNYKDHLGNIRMSYAKDPQTGDLKILEENHYFPFGLKHKTYANVDYKIDAINNESEKAVVGIDPNNDVQKATMYKYKYQEQELQDEHGLNWYSFKWRNYDPATGRFFNVDPLSEQYHDWGAYVFSGNRVIDARELEGLEPEIMNGEEYGLGGMDDLFGVANLEQDPIVKFTPEKNHEGFENEVEMDFIGGNYRVPYSANSWVKDHFEISGGAELTFGFQAGGGFKKAAAVHVDFWSMVISDWTISNKKEKISAFSEADSKELKVNRGFGFAYYGGFDYKRQTYQGVTTNEISAGLFGFGGSRTYDDNGNLVDWFWGFDPSFQAEFGLGLELNFKIGFSK